MDSRVQGSICSTIFITEQPVGSVSSEIRGWGVGTEQNQGYLRKEKGEMMTV